MSNRWLAIALVLCACRSRGLSEEERQRQAELAGKPDPWLHPQPKPAPAVGPVPVPDLAPAQQQQQQQQPQPQQQPQRSAPSECISSGTIATFEAGAVLRACFDRNGDGKGDRCVRWRPDGTPLAYDPAVDELASVEEGPEEAPEPVTFHSDTEHNDDTRILLDGGAIEICPYDRACLKLMPRVPDDHTIDAVVADADYRRAAVQIAVSGADNARAHIELWDLERGRAYAKLPFRGIMREGDHTFSVKLGRGALVALTTDTSAKTVSGAIYGLDGGFRGMLAGGARKLDLDGALETAGLFLVFEEQPDGKPYVLHSLDLATGTPARFVIPRADETADGLELTRIAPGVVAAVQWGKQLRLDVIDARTRAVRTLRVPTC